MGTEAEDHRIFVGRADAVEALRRRLDDARAGRGGVTLLVGDAGLGKSTLLGELVPEIRARGIRPLIAAGVGVDDPPPFSLIHAALEGGSSEVARRSGPTAPVGIGSEVLGIDSPRDPSSSAAPIDIEGQLLGILGIAGAHAKISPDRVLAGIADHFLEYARQGATALVLDDLHRADESSLAAVEFLVKHLHDQPLWILASSRRYATLSESKRARLEGFERATRAQQIILHPLTPGDVGSYLRMIDPGRKFTPSELERRYAESGGNPLLLKQQYQRISSGTEVREVPGGALPPLDQEAQRTLDVAAALGPEFSFDLLLGASSEDGAHLAKVVQRLVDRGLLFERPGDLLEFPQDRLREQAYGRLTESQRRVAHRRAGETREAMGRTGSTRIFGLARDFYLGKDDQKSLEYNRIAAEIAGRALAPDVARDFLARALESQRSLNPGDWESASKLALELARLTYELGRLEEAEGILRDVLGRGAGEARLSPGLEATLEILLGYVLSARGDLPAAVALAETVLAAPGLESERLVRIGAHHLLGLARYYQGQYAEALAHHTEELRLAREVGNESVIAHALTWHAGVLAMTGQADQALLEAREVVAMLDRAGTAGQSAQGHLFLGNMLADDKSNAQHRTEAIVELETAIRFGELAQDPRRVGWALYHLSELQREEGRLTDAVEKAQRAYETLGSVGDRVGQGVAIKVRGQVALARGTLEAAEADLLEAQRLLQGLKHTLEEVDVNLRLAQLSVARGDRAGASGRVAELERQNVSTVRPDLAAEFAALKKSLEPTEATGS